MECLLPTEAFCLKSHGLSQIELLPGLHQRASFLHQSHLFHGQKKMLRRSSNSPLPDHEDLTDLANAFNKLFVDKISNFMRNLVSMESNPTDPKYIKDQYTSDMRYSSFKQATNETITNIIGNAPSKSCELDPLPIGIVKEFTLSWLLHSPNWSICPSPLENFLGNLKEALLRP